MGFGKKNKNNINTINNEQNKNKKKTNKKKIKIPKTVQDTLDWECVFENGVFQIGPKRFSKTFYFEDIAFKTKSDEDQMAIYQAYLRFLNSINPDEDLFITFVNYKDDENAKLAAILPINKDDGFDNYRKELGTILRNNIKLSRNAISTKRYITVYVNADTVDNAMLRLNELETTLENAFKKICGAKLTAISLEERLEVINNILNGTDEANYWFVHDKTGKTTIDFKEMARQKLTTKDIIAPQSMKFYSNRFEINERIGQGMYLDNLANWMDTNFLPSLIAVNFESVFTIHISALEQTEAIKKVHNKSININAEIEDKMDARAAKGKDPTFINADLRKAQAEIEDLQNDIQNRDQKYFFMDMSIIHFAENKQILKEQEKIIKNSANKYMCSIKPALEQQERCLISTLPLGHNKMFQTRGLTTENLGVFLPFDEINQFDVNGIYYGVNAINKSLIVYDRTKGMNYNGLIFGASGSGKSFSAKREITSVLLNKNANCYIIDPDDEYTPIADAFGGTIIKISPGNGVYINPFDLDIDTSADSDLNPITMKIDFICGLLETMIGNNAKLSPTQISIVTRCVQQIYRPYLEHLQELPPDENGRKRTIDRDYCPTMQNLFDALINQPQSEAQNLALIMETYTAGAFDTFAHRTNVDIDNKFIIFNISNIGTNLKELGLKICVNHVWNKMVENRRNKKWTWFYIDEFHLLLKSHSTSDFIMSIFKRARKFLGVTTGITQNVGDLLRTEDGQAIINNTSFIYMLNQSAMDRYDLQKLLKLSDGDVEYVTNVEQGHGLIYTGTQTIPFSDDFPEDTKLYDIMTTKPKQEEVA